MKVFRALFVVIMATVLGFLGAIFMWGGQNAIDTLEKLKSTPNATFFLGMALVSFVALILKNFWRRFNK